ncbi:MAG TPA: hypothetical protein VFM14_03430 [Gemmatimonadales bacterium]|nr:hypothetical protein [Gemmatimonadales bacterium]
MSPGPRTVRWRNHTFHFETFQGRDLAGSHGPIWGVWWRSEFIGTMPAHADETTKEFEVRSVRWLADLLR